MNSLQVKAEELVQNFKFLEIFSQFGEAYLVGNVALKTTVKPDIDFVIYVDRKKWEDVLGNIKNIFENHGLTDFHERLLKESDKYLLSYDYHLDGIKWTIDITLSDKRGDYLCDSYAFYKDFSDKFTPERILVIKKIKEYFWKRDMLRNSMSYYIYRAVIDHDAKNVHDIFDYLKENKINISRFKRK